MKCISPLGCPLKTGECNKAGECYLWRCEHPAPKPVEDDELLQAFAELVLKVNASRGIA